MRQYIIETTKINDTNQDHQKYHAPPRDHIPAQRLLQRRCHVATVLRRLPSHDYGILIDQ